MMTFVVIHEKLQNPSFGTSNVYLFSKVFNSHLAHLTTVFGPTFQMNRLKILLAFCCFPFASESTSFPPKFKLATTSPCTTTRAPPVRTIYFPALADNVLPEFFLTLCPLPPFILANCGLECGGNNSPLEFYSSPEKLFLCVLIPDCLPCTDFRFNPVLPMKPLFSLPLFCWFCQFCSCFLF